MASTHSDALWFGSYINTIYFNIKGPIQRLHFKQRLANQLDWDIFEWYRLLPLILFDIV